MVLKIVIVNIFLLLFSLQNKAGYRNKMGYPLIPQNQN